MTLLDFISAHLAWSFAALVLLCGTTFLSLSLAVGALIATRARPAQPSLTPQPGDPRDRNTTP